MRFVFVFSGFVCFEKEDFTAVIWYKIIQLKAVGEKEELTAVS